MLAVDAVVVGALLPAHHAIVAAVDRRRRHWRPLAQALAHGQRHALGTAVQHRDQRTLALGIRGRVEGRAQRDHLAHQRIGALGQFAGVDARQAPSQQRHGHLRRLEHVDHAFLELAQPAVQAHRSRAAVDALSPVVWPETGLREQRPQCRGAFRPGAFAREHEHRLAFAFVEPRAVFRDGVRRRALEQLPQGRAWRVEPRNPQPWHQQTDFRHARLLNDL
ncbi:hypothetical protein ACPWT1_17075 [Ramlibacter sp. MMS24-I3-19]|uniref:hypothetical protein n=1 Tax=Ramlibacter sp. MMS24-I3-19 TaxID=3416606 RepID=UPI003CFD69DA